jgi:hypothetical protein
MDHGPWTVDFDPVPLREGWRAATGKGETGV